MKTLLEDKNIILGISGGIAAYKSAELVRLLIKNYATVRVIMTAHAMQFITPQTFAALTGQPVYTNLFNSDSEGASIRHIEWANQSDLVVIAPATANCIAKFAHGIADDALSTFFLAVTSPVLICPSMNVHMWQKQVVQDNIALLKKRGYFILSPDSGDLACGTQGAGRLPEPDVIVDRLKSLVAPKDLIHKRVIVTAGPTHEAIDPVRFITNPSSGKMGYAIARAAEYRGADVTLISGPTNLEPPINVKIIQVKTTEEMANAVFDQFEQSDIVVKSAAVADYRVDQIAEQKIKKTENELHLRLIKNQDILKSLGQKKTHHLLIGFAAETQHIEQNASKKLNEKNLDMIVANLIGPPHSGFQSDTNQVKIFYPNRPTESLPVLNKELLAMELWDRIVQLV